MRLKDHFIKGRGVIQKSILPGLTIRLYDLYGPNCENGCSYTKRCRSCPDVLNVSQKRH